MLTVETHDKYSLQIIVMRDYPDNLGAVIENLLTRDYVITGYYGDTGLEWILEYRGVKDTVLLELALSEYILDSATVNSIYDYTGLYAQHTRD